METIAPKNSGKTVTESSNDNTQVERRSNLVGRLVWRIVKEDSSTSGRSIFLIVGLNPQHLAGISRMYRSFEDGRSLCLAINPHISPEILSTLPSDHLSEDTPVYLRNSAKDNVVVVAVPDSERESVGSSLGEVVRIDRSRLQSETEYWVEEVKVSIYGNSGIPSRTRNWLTAMIQGLNRSGVTKELDQFAEFIYQFTSFPSGRLLAERLSQLGWVLNLPCGVFDSIPSEKSEVLVKSRDFERMFKESDAKYSGIPFLRSPDDNRHDAEEILERVRILRNQEAQNSQESTPSLVLNAVEELIKNQSRLRRGDWLACQDELCRHLDWGKHGEKIFGRRTLTKPKSLAQKTREHFDRQFPDEEQAMDFLTSLEDTSKVQSDKEKQQFFDDYEYAIRTNKRLYEMWRRHLFASTVKDEPDLLMAILEGVQTVLIKNFEPDQEINRDIRFIVEVKDCEKASTWEELDKRTFGLFRFEAQLLSGALSNKIEFRFGKWLDQQVFKASENRTRKDARVIELEVSIAGDVLDKVESFQKVRVFWQPSESGKDDVSLAWREDIEGLYDGMIDNKINVSKGEITPQGTTSIGRFPISLRDTSSFSDTTGGKQGRTASPAKNSPEENYFKLMTDALDDLTDRNIITRTINEDLTNSFSAFQDAFSVAILEIYRNPKSAYRSNLIREQARLFGELCSKSREHLVHENDTRHILQEICEFGIVKSRTSQKIAIIPAWHPLRLLERLEKAKGVAKLIETLCEEGKVTADGLERAGRKYREILSAWCYPEIVAIGPKIYAAIEHGGGYSMVAQVDGRVGSIESLEVSSHVSSQQFMKVADEYLTLNPHEECNFSTAIYNSETASLPSKIAEDLEQKMASRKDLRCSLFITHDKPAKMRHLYAQQTALLKGKNFGPTAAGFLSRLRVGVRTGSATAQNQRAPEIDIVFLHEVFFQNSEITWDQIRGSSDNLPECIDLLDNLLPRRQSGEGSSPLVQIALSPMRLPRSVAQFVDLCFAVNKDGGVIGKNRRAVPMRRISSDSGAVKSAIKNAHDIADWVVSFDRLSSRDMFTRNGINIIRDILIPDTEAHLIVSAREPSLVLQNKIKSEFEQMGTNALSTNAERYAARVIEEVVQIAGQKVMAAARSIKTARELIGLAAAVGIVQSLQEKRKVETVWFSLDDNVSTFELRGKIADMLSVSIEKTSEGTFSIDLTVVEAKCVSKESEAATKKSSWQQTLSTMNNFIDNFVDQTDPVARKAWGADFLSLLSLRPRFSRLLSSRDDLESFKNSLVRGMVEFSVQGRSVIVLHDDVNSEGIISRNIDQVNHDIVQHQIGRRGLASIFAYLDDRSTINNLIIDDPIDLHRHNRPSTLEWGDSQIQSEQHTTSEVSLEQKGAQNGGETTTKIDAELPATPSSDQQTKTDEISGDSSLPSQIGLILKNISEESGSAMSESVDSTQAREYTTRLQVALMGYGMQAEFTAEHMTITPNGVIVRFKGHDSLTAKKLSLKKEELKSTHALDVVDARSGLGEVSCYIARPDRQIIRLASVWLQAKWPESIPDELTSLLVGVREDNGSPLWLNLSAGYGGNTLHGPHTLIAGETGSGKGVLIQNILLQLIAFNSPKNLQLYVVDPKLGADFFWISEAPHLVGGIISNQEESERVLTSLVHETDRRYALISNARTPNITEYNRKVPATERLSRIVIVHDEMADWMVGSEEYRKMIQGTMTRIAAKARACGMNVFLVTQRASQDAIPVGIRDNLNNRLCLKVASKAGSELALKVSGGEFLLGQGQLAANLSGDRPDSEAYFIAQVPFATTEQLEELGKAAIANWT